MIKDDFIEDKSDEKYDQWWKVLITILKDDRLQIKSLEKWKNAFEKGEKDEKEDSIEISTQLTRS